MSVWKITGIMLHEGIEKVVYREFTQDDDFAIGAEGLGHIKLPNGKTVYLRTWKIPYQVLPPLLGISVLVHGCVEDDKNEVA